MVDEDSRAGDRSYGVAQREEGDGEDVVAADVTHSHEESCSWKQTCKERMGGCVERWISSSLIIFGSLCVFQCLVVTLRQMRAALLHSTPELCHTL